MSKKDRIVKNTECINCQFFNEREEDCKIKTHLNGYLGQIEDPFNGEKEYTCPLPAPAKYMRIRDIICYLSKIGKKN